MKNLLSKSYLSYQCEHQTLIYDFRGLPSSEGEVLDTVGVLFRHIVLASGELDRPMWVVVWLYGQDKISIGANTSIAGRHQSQHNILL